MRKGGGVGAGGSGRRDQAKRANAAAAIGRLLERPLVSVAGIEHLDGDGGAPVHGVACIDPCGGARTDQPVEARPPDLGGDEIHLETESGHHVGFDRR